MSSQMTFLEDILNATSSPASASGPMHSENQDGPTTAPSGPDHALASLSAAQASEKGLLTSGTYGHTGSTSSRSAALATSLENRLRAKTDGLGSTLYKLTWKHWDLPSGRQICALRASVRRTSGKDSGSMGVARQDTTHEMACRYDERVHGRRQRRADTRAATWVAGTIAANGQRTDWRTAQLSGWSHRRHRTQRGVRRIRGRSTRAWPLSQQMALSGWPTTELQQRQGGATSDNEARGRDEEPATLAGYNRTSGWPTPNDEQHERCLSRPGQNPARRAAGAANLQASGSHSLSD